MMKAAASMEAGIEATARHCQESGIPIAPINDPNGTCLVGPELTELFTSLGQLEAKRSASTPDMAGLLVHLLSKAGVGPGDRVALGASGSFPALFLAAAAAVDALGAEPVTILSLGASSFGATRPEFHLLDLHELLQREGLLSTPPAAVSLGGSGDMGGEFDPTFREGLLQDLGGRGVPILQNPAIQLNVAERMALYGGVDAFVNIGGAEANLGSSPRILSVPPGLVEPDEVDLPPVPERGVLFEMVSRGVPVIHLLHLQVLALRYGLPWDPLPLPEPGSTRLKDTHGGKNLLFWILTLGYLTVLGFVAFAGRKDSEDKTVR